jgi:DNA polymerase-3 subunit alpha
LNYTPYHVHSDLSILDSATKSKMYIEKVKELGIKAFGESNHGNIFNWVKRKQMTEEAGIKYIHAQEFYITETLQEKIRDNYHTILIAKNWEGVKELNKLSSVAYNRQDNHFYYDPRISIDELLSTSNNIIVTSACLASPLWKGKDKNIYNKYLQFFITNKHRCFLEIQYHNCNEQKEYNKQLYELHRKYDIPLIAGTDTHSINQDYAEARKILMQAKNIAFTNEDTFDLTFKSYDELVETFKEQNVLPMNIILEAIENTNVMADMIEEFTLDTTPKYPKLYDNSEEVFKQKIQKGIKKRSIDKLDEKTKQIYMNRINYEYEVYKKCGAIDYMLMQKDIIDWCHKNNIWQGYSRGSVSGSLVAYVLGITEADSIKYNLNFERFMNPERVSLPDIDVDYPPSQRDKVKKYVFNKPNIHCADIITFNTIALKGAIRDVARALKIPLNEVNYICNNIDKQEEEFRKLYPKLFKYVDLLNGVNTSVGFHPCGSITSPITLEDNIGLFTTSTDEYPISQINMKEIDSLNYVKLDLLALDNIEIINETCKLAKIKRLTPDNVDTNDEKVWNSILESNLGIFQWEGNKDCSIQ